VRADIKKGAIPISLYLSFQKKKRRAHRQQEERFRATIHEKNRSRRKNRAGASRKGFARQELPNPNYIVRLPVKKNAFTSETQTFNAPRRMRGEEAWGRKGNWGFELARRTAAREQGTIIPSERHEDHKRSMRPLREEGR